MSVEPIRTLHVDRISVHVFASGEALGQRAADDLAAILKAAVGEKGEASVILATGNSQLRFMEALRVRQGIPWDQVVVFHMDDYLGMSDRHPASFPRYIREKLVDHVAPRAFYPMRGDAADVEAELARYAALLEEHPPDACVLGIGENGHLAFNDPPADFETKASIHVVELDRRCRMQQVGEGHFATLADVPRQAISLTVPALLSARRVLAVVPEARKAEAVRAALEGPVTPACPASILRTQPQVTMYLDTESAALLST
ncbi:MAG TPA: glucosamine-6-phosphate deaminase [Anaerolineae bacterium]|nr:glucosamine-6-phosphate deaminase [Anaerolineae bacterium]